MKISGNTFVGGVQKPSPTGGRSEAPEQAAKTKNVEKSIPGNDVRSAVENASDVDMSEVERIRNAISNGELSMDSKTLAYAVMDMHDNG